MTGTSEGAKKANETKREESGSSQKSSSNNPSGGRGSNMSDADRRKSEHSPAGKK